MFLYSSDHDVYDSLDHDENQAIHAYFDGFDTSGFSHDFAMVLAYQEFDFSRIGTLHITCTLT